eukprot:TRINITY_DN34149_c0_g1_i1.p1 TRINITY_DN34149_c0_g1~~TRINITY_DN34149_c0_g1_i1.p1  ORF type:complete len:259 (+),score=37.37 TRINITY_DN34149_c0_g1_i1:85-777(+)
MALYLLGLWGLWLWMRNRKPLDVDIWFALHNWVLCALSLVMSLGFAFAFVRMVSLHGLFATYCGTYDDVEDATIVQWAHVFYLSKYWELLDTVFLVLRKKPLTFLHVYHHAVVLIVCWLACHDMIIMGWVTAFNNANVHIFMYWYYAKSTITHKKPWWAKYLTTAQILQFNLDNLSSLLFGYLYFFTQVPCRGTLRAWIIANLVGLSFCALFVQYYRARYTPGKKEKKTE